MSKTISITVTDEEYSDLLNLGLYLRDSTQFTDEQYNEFKRKVSLCSYEVQLASAVASNEKEVS